MFRKQEITTYWPFYLQTVFLNLSKVILPFWVLYFLNIGLNFLQIALITSIRSLAFLLMEIPTGVLADIIGRKKVVIAGYFLTAVTYFLIPFFHDFWPLAFIFTINGFCETLFSQSDQAWAIDASSDNRLSQGYLFRTRALRNIGMIIAPIMGGMIVARFGMTYLWPVFAFGIVLSTFFLFFAPESKFLVNKKNIWRDIKSKMLKQAKQSLIFLRDSLALKILFGAILLFAFVEEITSLVWTPYLMSVGINAQILGLLFAIIAIVGVVLPNLANWAAEGKKKKIIMLVSTAIYALILIAAGFLNQKWLIVAFFIVFSSIDEIFIPLEETLTNEQLTSHYRATILSAKSMIMSTSAIIGSLVAGVIATRFNNNQTLLIAGLVLAFLPLLYWLFFRSKNIKKMGLA